MVENISMVQKLTYHENSSTYELPVICIVQLKSKKYSTVCIIDNEVQIMINNPFIQLGDFIVDGVNLNLESYAQQFKTGESVNDYSGTYLWISTENNDDMKFLKIEKWNVIQGGFLKSSFVVDNEIKYTDSIIGNKIYCLNNTYLALKDIVK